MIFVPCVVANRDLAFLWWFWCSGFFLAVRPFDYRTHFSMDIDTFVPVSSIFTMSFAVVQGLICTFCTKVPSSLGDRACLLPERYDGCVFPWYLYLCTIVCTDERGTFGNCSQGRTRLVEVMADFLIFFPMMSNQIKCYLSHTHG